MAIANVVPQGSGSTYVSQFLQVTNELILLVNQLLSGNLSVASFNVTGNVAIANLYSNFVKLNGNDLTDTLQDLFVSQNTQALSVNIAGALANAAGAIANAAFFAANQGFVIANSAYGLANSLISVPAGAFATINAAYATINAAGSVANEAFSYQTSEENRIVNGDFRIDQRMEGGQYYANSNNAGGMWTLDSWVWFYTAPFPDANNPLVIITQNQGPVPSWNGSAVKITDTDVGLPFVALISTNNTSFANANTGATYQTIVEGCDMTDFGWGNAFSYTPNPASQNVMLTFWVNASNTGNYSLLLASNNYSRYYLTTYNVATSNSWTYQTIVIPPDNEAFGGLWTIDVGYPGLYVNFCLGASNDAFGTTSNVVNQWQSNTGINYGIPFGAPNTVNFMASAGNVLALKEVRMRVGSFDVPYTPRNYWHELKLCKRRFQKSWPIGAPVGANNSNYTPFVIEILGNVAGTSGGSPNNANIIPPYWLPHSFPFDVELAGPSLRNTPGLPNTYPIITLFSWDWQTYPEGSPQVLQNNVWVLLPGGSTGNNYSALAGSGFTKYFNRIWNTSNTTWAANGVVVFHYTVESGIG